MVRTSCKKCKIKFCSKCNKCKRCKACTCAILENQKQTSRPSETATGKRRGPYAPKETNPLPSRRSKRTRSQNVSPLSSSYGDESISNANDSDASLPQIDSDPSSIQSVDDLLPMLGYSKEGIARTKKQIGSKESRENDTNLLSTNKKVFKADSLLRH